MSQYKKQQERRLSGASKRLLAAVMIFLFCYGARVTYPEQSQRAADWMRYTLSSSSHFEDAFSTLGQDLSNGKSLSTSVGSWCVTVFAPQEVTIPLEEADSEKKDEPLTRRILHRIKEWMLAADR